MSRCAISDVKLLIDTSLADANITACITAANTLVNNGPATSTNPALGTDELFQIEQWVAAHFVNMQDPIALRSRIGDADQRSFPESVTTAWSKGLGISVFGQTALVLDRSGLLAKTGLMKGSFRAAPREDGAHFTKNLTKDGL